MASLDDCRAAQRLLSRRWLARNARRPPRLGGRHLSVADAVAAAGNTVHAVGIGRRCVAGRVTTTRVVQFFVEQKLRKSLLLQRDLIPAAIDGIPVDVVESRPAVASGGRRGRRLPGAAPQAGAAGSLFADLDPTRPIRPGLSAAHVDVTFGTLGCLCRSSDPAADPAAVFVLGNNHVFAACNRGAIGDDLFQPSPGDFDGPRADSHFADLVMFEPLRFDGAANSMDAAVGQLRPGVAFTSLIPQIGRPHGFDFARDRQRVCKFGRTSDYTEGVVRNLFYDVNVTYRVGGVDRVASFEDQLRIEPAAPFSRWALPGDSGALVTAMPASGRTSGLGLHFSGPDDGSYGVACQIAVVFDRLQLTFA